MLAHAHAEENGTRTPPHGPAVFLTHALLPPHIAADSELINKAFVGSHRNRRVRYDFDKISLATFPASIKILRSGIPYNGTFSERK